MKEKVTILMTTYNEEKKIFEQALKSILNQTYQNIKILIIVDNKENIDIVNTIKVYKEIDDRISYIINEHNLGLPQSLNKGIDIIDTEYIARMDADDVAIESRIEKQLKFALDNNTIDLFGANICYIDYEGNELYKRNSHPVDNKSIKQIMKYINVFHHPTLFGKTDVFRKYKYRNLKYAQDYDLLCRLLENDCYVSNMNDYLLYYRLSKVQNEEKLYFQKIAFYCIQKAYKKGKLGSLDIQRDIALQIKKYKKERVIKGILLFENAMTEYKRKKYIKFAVNIIKSGFCSKIQCIQIWNMIQYYKWKKGN